MIAIKLLKQDNKQKTLHQEQHQKVKWIKDDRKSVCFNRRTLLIFAGNLFRRGAGYEERTGIAY